MNGLVHLLGALALLPFVAGAIGAWVGDVATRASFAQALAAYAAVVVSFIGGIHWGFGFRQATPTAPTFVWGVVPSIVAWGAQLTPPHVALWSHATTLVVCWFVDRATYPAAGAAAWLPLRARLTIGAVACCVAGALGS